MSVCLARLTGRPEPGSRAAARARISLGHNGDDAYHHGVQIAELNALNAAFAVIAFKKASASTPT